MAPVHVIKHGFLCQFLVVEHGHFEGNPDQRGFYGCLLCQYQVADPSLI
jgi:hypothetical protein